MRDMSCVGAKSVLSERFDAIRVMLSEFQFLRVFYAREDGLSLVGLDVLFCGKTFRGLALAD
jgi:hypothetical protein